MGQRMSIPSSWGRVKGQGSNAEVLPGQAQQSRPRGFNLAPPSNQLCDLRQVTSIYLENGEVVKNSINGLTIAN